MIERLLDLPLFRLELPTPFPVGPVNIYLVTEPEPVLIDTGPEMPGSLDLLEKLLGEAGLRVEGLRRIIISHAHQDHYGLAQVLARRSGAPVYASRLDHLHLTHHQRIDRFYAAMLEQAGAPRALMQRLEQQFLELRRLARPLQDYRPIEQMPPLRCGAAVFQPAATPGHTPGSFSFFEPDRRVLLSSDTVIKHITPNPVLDLDDAAPHGRFPALAAYLNTLARIRALNPAVIYTGHGEPVENFPELHDRVLAHHRNRREALRRCLLDGERTIYQACACLFPEPRTHNSFLAISEVIAHLDLMEEAGEVAKRFDGTLAFYGMKHGATQAGLG